MKILHLTDLFAPSIGGMESCVLYLAREQTRRGHEVSVVTLVRPEGAPTNRVEDIGFRVHRIASGYGRFHWAWSSADKPHHPPFPDPVVASQLRRIIQQERPDAVHAHNWIAFSYLAIKSSSSAPLLWTLHDYSLCCPKKTLIYYREDGRCPGSAPVRCIACSREQYGSLKGTAVTLGLLSSYKAMYRRIDRFIGISAAVARQTQLSLGLPAERFSVIHSFIENDAASIADTTPRPDFLPAEDGYLLFVGALGAHKGIRDLIEAYELLGADAPPLVLLGTPKPDTPKAWPDRVIVRENVPHDQVMASWKHAGVGIVPSRYAEGFGLVALEAAITGRPVVATRTGGLAEIVIDGVTGLLVPPREPAAIARAVRHLLDNPLVASDMGSAARIRAKEFTLTKAADSLDRVLADVIAERAGP